MITAIVFDDTVPYTIDLRSSRFASEDGWVIAEIESGRVGLAHADYGCITVQSMPYVIFQAIPPDAIVPLSVSPSPTEPAPQALARNPKRGR